MSNDINLCIKHLLSLDDTDLTSSQIITEKLTIIANEEKRNTPVAKFTDNYWNNNMWHFKSLKSLLGNTSSTWYNNKISLGEWEIERNDRPLIKIESSLELTSRSLKGLIWNGFFTIEIATDSSKDLTKLEHLTRRVIKHLGSFTSIEDHVLNNGIVDLSFLIDTITTISKDSVRLKYNIGNVRFVGI